MPLFKGQGCKSTPTKAIAYITDDKKAEIVTSQNLDDSRSYAEQFKETAKLYNKGKGFDERKYYHFKLSCDRADDVSFTEHHKYAVELAEKLFPGYECVIATHSDTETIHSHIIMNSVSFQNGKKFHCSNYEYGKMKDFANELGLEKGFTSLDFRKPAHVRVTSKELIVEMKGGTSWKEELREVIQLAKQSTNSMQDFEKYLNNYGVTITRNTDKTIAFKHPQKVKAIRGEKLGLDYTKGVILNELNGNGRNISEREITRNEQAEQNGIGEQLAKGELDGVYSSIREVEDGAKQFSATGRAELRERERAKQRESKDMARKQFEKNKRAEQECNQPKGKQRDTDRQHTQPYIGFDR